MSDESKFYEDVSKEKLFDAIIWWKQNSAELSQKLKEMEEKNASLECEVTIACDDYLTVKNALEDNGIILTWEYDDDGEGHHPVIKNKEINVKKNYRIVRQCMEFQGFNCKNTTCISKMCPLNKINGGRAGVDPKES